MQHIPPEVGDLSKLSALNLCSNQIQHLPHELNRLSSLESLYLHGNQLQTLPKDIINLSNLQELSLRNNPLVLRFIRDWPDNVATLLELSGRAVKKANLHYDSTCIPETLVEYLDSAQKCDNVSCQGYYFTSRIRRVKFVDFCGKYRVPLMHYLCSTLCDNGDDSSSSCPSSSSEEDAGEMAQHRIKKVLLG